MEHRITILMTEFVTHDVKRFIVKKPETFSFTAGQGVELAIDEKEWREEGRPFTPTSLASDKVLEFTIKRYPDHKGVTDRLHCLKPGDSLLMSDPFGTISYKGAGVFIGAGAGITPFLAIFRQLAADKAIARQALIFSNKTPADVICEKELRFYFNSRGHFICTRESGPGYEKERINRNYLEKILPDTSRYVYVCGPDKFVEDITAMVKELGVEAEALVFEE
ncbi:MAG: flavodoxin reductase [Deltaproteobacteria bacterium]|jgi:cytochrome-b5 reductase|nr:flavodoxin reductase [Deltaproteobacteria bacterium]